MPPVLDMETDGIEGAGRRSVPIHEHVTVSSGEDLAAENVSHQLRPVGKRTQLHVLISSFLVICITIGFNSSYGVFQDYYVSSENTLLPPSSNALVAFIGTLGAGLTWGCSVVVNPVMARTKDPRYIPTAGVTLMGVGLALASLSTQIWHLLLTQGLLYGVGSSLLYYPTLSVAPEYFDHHRGGAMGFILSGSGVGGLVLSPIIRALIANVGIRWTLRFFCLFITLVSLPISLTAVPSRFSGRRPTHINIALAKKPTFLLSVIGAFLQASGSLIPLTFIPEYSVALGYSAAFGAVLLAVSNGVNTVSRILSGFAGDRFGRQNTCIATVALSAMTICGFWLGSALNGSRTLWLICVVCYGIFAGGYNALYPTTIAEIFGLQSYASVNGFIYFIRGSGYLVGSPVAGAILGTSIVRNYTKVILYDATLLVSASFFVTGVRYYDAVNKKEWKWRA